MVAWRLIHYTFSYCILCQWYGKLLIQFVMSDKQLISCQWCMCVCMYVCLSRMHALITLHSFRSLLYSKNKMDEGNNQTVVMEQARAPWVLQVLIYSKMSRAAIRPNIRLETPLVNSKNIHVSQQVSMETGLYHSDLTNVSIKQCVINMLCAPWCS